MFIINAILVLLCIAIGSLFFHIESHFLFTLILLRTFFDSIFFAIALPYFQASKKFHIISCVNIFGRYCAYDVNYKFYELFDQTLKISNDPKIYAKIYGFDTLDYADDIASYRDFIHYNVDMNSLHLDSIKQGKHILDSNNIDSYLKVMEDKDKLLLLESDKILIFQKITNVLWVCFILCNHNNNI